MSTVNNQSASATSVPEWVTDPNYKPVPGALGNMTVIQANTLEKFRKELQDEGHFVPERHDDACLLRFLRARKFDLAKAKEMMISGEQWRKEFGADELYRTFKFDEAAAVDKYYPQFYHKTDIDGRPVYVQRLGKLDLVELYKVTTEERCLQRLVYEYERSFNDRLPACEKACGHPVETFCTILDLKDVGLTGFYKVKDFVFKASSIGQDRYPETMGKFYIINAPWTFTTVWTVIKRWLDPVTVAKVDILGGESEYKPKLLAQIPAENLPKELGGSCACEGGCSLSDAGPWMESD